jgi:putative ABC transport system permease protein
LLALFSVLAVLLAAVGIFGLMAQVVVRRTAEIGLRMARGANRRDVLAMVLRQGVLLAAAGGVVGIVGAFGMARLLRSLLFGVSAVDPISYAGAALVMALAILRPSRMARGARGSDVGAARGWITGCRNDDQQQSELPGDTLPRLGVVG